VILSGWLAWQVRPGRSAVWAPIIVGLSSPLLVYSLEFWEHTPGAFLAVLALVGIVKAADSRRPSAWLMLSGAAVGLGLTMRAELYVFPVAVAIGLLFARPTLPFFRSALMLAVGGACVAGPWWIYQAIRWGHPLGPRIVQNVPVFGGSDVLAKLGDTTGRNWAMLWPSRGDSLEALAVAGIAVGLLALAVRLLQRRRVSKAASLHLSAAARAAAPAWWILVSALLALVAITTWRVVRWQLVVDQRPDDLLTTFPLILLLLLPARQPAWWQDWRMRFLAITSAAFALLVVIASPFQGGLQWGPRFLLPIISPLAVVIAARLGQLWQQSHRGARMGVALVFTGLLLAGSYSTWTGFQFMRDNQATNARLSDMIEGAPERVVVADAWFLPQGAPYTSGSKIWFLAEDQTLMFKLIQRLRKTTNEPGMIYVSSLTWTHLDPLVLMGPRIAPNGDPQFVDAPGQYLQITRYFLYK
jgi:hypothetical protein